MIEDDDSWRMELDIEVAELARDARSLMVAAIEAAQEVT